jgi:thermitase
LIGMVAALAPESRVVSIRILDAKGMGNWSDLERGLERATAVGAHIVFIPISTRPKSLPEGVIRALNAGLAKGSLYVAPSGVSGREGADFPASHAGVVGVGAVDREGKLFYATNYGTGVMIFAPGAVVRSLKNGFVSVSSGTAQAAAIAPVSSRSCGRRNLR